MKNIFKHNSIQKRLLKEKEKKGKEKKQSEK
jgi:hypothetical protein